MFTAPTPRSHQRLPTFLFRYFRRRCPLLVHCATFLFPHTQHFVLSSRNTLTHSRVSRLQCDKICHRLTLTNLLATSTFSKSCTKVTRPVYAVCGWREGESADLGRVIATRKRQFSHQVTILYYLGHGAVEHEKCRLLFGPGI